MFMDKVFELFEKYHCHLRRDIQSVADLLENNFIDYINDLRNSVSVEDNPHVGEEMCAMIKDSIKKIRDNAHSLVEVLRLYDNGKVLSATEKAFNVFNDMKLQLMQRYSGAYHKDRYYRIREIKNAQFPLERKELFHIPHNKNHLVGATRYSIPGIPCLYLSTQAEIAWFECGMPKKFAIAEFSIPQDEEQCLNFIDFSQKIKPLKHSFYSWFNDKDNIDLVRKYFLKYIYTYPLRAACSVVVRHPDAKFIEEYVIPQLLLQWVCKDDDFDGVCYESCFDYDDIESYGGHNIVLVTKQYDVDGYDKELRNCIKIGSPEVIDVDKQIYITKVLDLLSKKHISDDYQAI